ncbi:MAG: amidohydrolase family protein [Planctomycetota bacterium]
MTATPSAPSSSEGLVLQPDWIVPIESAVISQGYLVVVSGSIAHIGSELPDRFRSLPSVRLERTAILPGLINSHCHLEFSDLPAPIPATEPFAGWLSRVVEQRSAMASLTAEERLEARRNAIRRGLIESWQHGVRWVVDNVTSPWNPVWIAELQSEVRRELSPLAVAALAPSTLISVQPCFELIDVQEKRWQETSAFAFEQIGAPKLQGIGAYALAPHAPYTASLRVTERAAEWSRPGRGLVSMHLAETREELQWLNDRAGCLGEWISPKLDATHRSHLGTVDAHLEALSTSSRALVVHGNYLTERQIEFLSTHRHRMAVVYCPRTHAWFRHSAYPVASLRSQGVPVLLGTDSRASNPDLNLWGEVRQAAHGDAGTAAEWIRGITTGAARFLELPFGIGRLDTGSPCSLTAMRWDADAGPGRFGPTEEGWWNWMIQHGNPYPLESDPRFARAGIVLD